jgi:uncharacterized protein
MLIKVLLLFAIGWGVYTFLRSYQRKLDLSQPRPASTVEDMVRCVQCGVNVPRSEAIYSGGEMFCCPEHQKLGRKST